jgi:CRISPR-associated endoribonuclease Cas6
MRCRVSVRKISPDPLHYDYQYGLASMLYLKLATSNVELADKTHSKKGFKFYTFSNLILDDRTLWDLDV